MAALISGESLARTASTELTKPLWGKDKSTDAVCRGRPCGRQCLHLEKQLFSAVQAVLRKVQHEPTVEDLY